MEDRILPCPDCPPDCGRICDTCKVFCKIYKAYAKEHAAPRPRVSVNDKYATAKNAAIKRRKRRG